MPKWMQALGALQAVSIAMAVPAYANGRTSPRTTDQIVVHAGCEQKRDGVRTEIYRARIGGMDVLRFRIADSGEELPLNRIRSLTLSDEAPQDGFTKASLVRNGEQAGIAASVQIGDPSSPVRLVGFGRDSQSVSVALQDCRRIDFFDNTEGLRTFAGEKPAAKN